LAVLESALEQIEEEERDLRHLADVQVSRINLLGKALSRGDSSGPAMMVSIRENNAYAAEDLHRMREQAVTILDIGHPAIVEARGHEQPAANATTPLRRSTRTPLRKKPYSPPSS
jgi:hypothetical protein